MYSFNLSAMQTHHPSLSKLFTIATLTASLAACGGGGGGGGGDGGGDSEHSSEGTHSSFATSSTAATNGVAGQALYAAYCASCHGASFAEATNYARTLSAIARNKGGMGYLSSSIQTAQANDIATYLTYGAVSTTSSQTPTPTPTLTAQTINFASPGDQTLSSTAVALTANASSSLPVTLTSSTPNVCVANGASLSLLGVGTCTVTASQLGDTAFAAATPVNVSFSVTVPAAPALSAQTISFPSPGNLMLASTTSALAATATSGLAVSFASATPSVCSVSGTTLNLRLPGTCTVAANQTGDATYAAAATVSNTFYVVAANAAAGKAAYNLAMTNGQSCASCHGVPGSQPTSLILSAANADVVLSSAIQNNVGGMGTLNGLYTPQQIIDITAYLATPGF